MNAVINAVNVACDVMFDTTVGVWTTSVASGALLVFLFAKLLGFGFRGIWAKVAYTASLILLVAVGAIYCANTHHHLTAVNNELNTTKTTLAEIKASYTDELRCYESMVNHSDVLVKSLSEELDKTKNELTQTTTRANETEKELSEIQKEKEELAERYNTLWKNVKNIENSVNNITSDTALNETAEQASEFFAGEIESLMSNAQHEIIREQLLNSL